VNATTPRALAAALVLALVAGCSRPPADEAEEKAVRAIEQLGGRITRDDKAEGPPVVRVDLSKTQVTDAELKELQELKGLQDLALVGTQVTDAGLKELKDLKGLQTLNLTGTHVTDAGLKRLKEALPKCRISCEPTE
jgi:hypothetical protein